MYSLAKELLFLHGHIIRPEDLDPTLALPDTGPTERANAKPAKKNAPPIGEAQCGAC